MNESNQGVPENLESVPMPSNFPSSELQIEQGARLYQYVIQKIYTEFPGYINRESSSNIVNWEGGLFTLLTGITPTNTLEDLSKDQHEMIFRLLESIGIAGEGKLLDRIESPDLVEPDKVFKYKDYHPYQYINRISCAQLLKREKLFNEAYGTKQDPKKFLEEHISEWIEIGNSPTQEVYGKLSGFPPEDTKRYMGWSKARAIVNDVNAGKLGISSITEQVSNILAEKIKYKDQFNRLVPFFVFTEEGKAWCEYLNYIDRKYFVKQ